MSTISTPEDELSVSEQFSMGGKTVFCCLMCWAKRSSAETSTESVFPRIEELSEGVPSMWHTNKEASQDYKKSRSARNTRDSLPKLLPTTICSSEGDIYLRNIEVPKVWGSVKTCDNRPEVSAKSIWDSYFESHSNCSKWADNSTAYIDGTWTELPDCSTDSARISKNTPGGVDVSPTIPELLPTNTKSERKVLLSYYWKGGMRTTKIPLDTPLELVAKWLNKGSVKSIPISENLHPWKTKKPARGASSKTTLTEVFGDYLDPERDGIVCFVGPVEGRISYKMSICERNMLQRACTGNRVSSFGSTFLQSPCC